MIKTIHGDPRFVILILLLIVVSGTVGFLTRPQLEDPQTKVRWGFVTTVFTGASRWQVVGVTTQ